MVTFKNNKEIQARQQYFEEDIQYPEYLHSIDYDQFNGDIAFNNYRKAQYKKRLEEEYLEAVAAEAIQYSPENCIQENAIQDSHSRNDIQLSFEIGIQ